jgi:hypothetical protein
MSFQAGGTFSAPVNRVGSHFIARFPTGNAVTDFDHHSAKFVSNNHRCFGAGMKLTLMNVLIAAAYAAIANFNKNFTGFANWLFNIQPFYFIIFREYCCFHGE